MAIDFPDSPSNNDTYTVGSKTWVYSSAQNQWLISPTSPAPSSAQYVTLAVDSTLSSERVLTAGTGVTVTDSGANSNVTIATSAILPTVIDAKGDLLVGTAADTVTRLGVGSNGDLLVADSGATEGLRWQGQQNTGRNLVINGAMQVAQRGTSKTGITTTGYYTADRWRKLLSGLGTWTQTIENDAPTGSGLKKSFKVLCTTADASPAAADIMAINQRFEGQDLQRIKKGTSAAEQLTLSFWVKSNVTGTYIAELLDNDNSRGVSASYTVSASATWEKKTITFPADTTGAFDNNGEFSFALLLFLGAGTDFTSGTLATTWASLTNANRAVGQTNLAAATNNYWQITGVQLEVGPVATGFDFEPYETTLRKCQRYYYRAAPGGGDRPLGNGWNRTTTTSMVNTRFPVTMRTRPTALEQTGTASDYRVFHADTATNCSSVPTFNEASTDEAATVFTVASGFTIGQGSGGRTNAAGAYLAWSAEL